MPRQSARPGFLLALALAVSVSACGAAGGPIVGGKVRVVAAENFWGSIARQIGGAHADVTSIIVEPAQDPHSYEPTTADARTLAMAQLAIVNGAGYDPWAPKLLAANPGGGRVTLTVGHLFGLHEGDNPHRWYDPAEVLAVAQTIAADLSKLDPADKSYFAQRLAAFNTQGLATYHRLIAQIRAHYAGTPVGASESVFALQSPTLGLDLITPPGLMKAISEGTDITAHDTITAERQLTGHQVKVWIYNSQNVTPEIKHLSALAEAAHIPIATVTETLSPATVSFEQWQVRQLAQLQRALHQATGK